MPQTPPRQGILKHLKSRLVMPNQRRHSLRRKGREHKANNGFVVFKSPPRYHFPVSKQSLNIHKSR
jgi:hypothetical protein